MHVIEKHGYDLLPDPLQVSNTLGIASPLWNFIYLRMANLGTNYAKVKVMVNGEMMKNTANYTM